MHPEIISITHKPEEETEDHWLEASIENQVVARLRYERRGKTTLIKFITVHPQYTGRGIARSLVELFKECSEKIIAKGVKYKARGFWTKVGFKRDEKNFNWNLPRCSSLGESKATPMDEKGEIILRHSVTVRL